VEIPLTHQRDGRFSGSVQRSLTSPNLQFKGKYQGKEIRGSPYPIGYAWIAKEFFQTSRGMKILYNAKRDGSSNESFHRKCDYTEKTIVVVSLSNNTIFGGYNPGSWESPSSGFFLPLWSLT